MTFTKVILALACLMSGTLVAQEAKVTQLLSKDLPGSSRERRKFTIRAGPTVSRLRTRMKSTPTC